MRIASYTSSADVLASSRLGAMKNIQRGTITIPDLAASATATLAAVVMARSICRHAGRRADVDNNLDNFTRLELTDTTTVTASRVGTTDTVVIAYEVTEFNA